MVRSLCEKKNKERMILPKPYIMIFFVCVRIILRWSLNQRWAPLRRMYSSSFNNKRKKKGQTATKMTQSASEAAAAWEADWRSAKTAEANIAGNTDDLVRGAAVDIEGGGGTYLLRSQQ